MLAELAQEKTLKLTVQFSGLASADSADVGLASADSKFLTFWPHARSLSLYVYGTDALVSTLTLEGFALTTRPKKGRCPHMYP